MKLKYYLLLILFIGGSVPVHAQANWKWIKKFGKPVRAETTTLSADIAGNIYAGGKIYYDLNEEYHYTNFDSNTVYFSGKEGAFIAKLDENGNFIWAKGGGSNISLPDHPYDYDITGKVEFCDSLNTLFVMGRFGTLTGYFSSQPLFNHGQTDIFYGMYDTIGNIISINSFGGRDFYDYVEGATFTIDKEGNRYILGGSGPEPTWFGPFSDNDTIERGSYILKMDTSGEKNILTHLTHPNYGIGKIKYFDDKLLAIGAFINNLSLNGEDTMTSPIYNPIISVLDTTTELLWYKRIYSDSMAAVTDIAADENNNIYITGVFQDSLNIDDEVLVTNAKNIYDIFLIKLDSTGEVQWGRQLFTEYPDTDTMSLYYQYLSGGPSAVIEVDSEGNIALAGTIFGSATFGSTTINTGGYEHAFLARYDSTGDCIGFNQIEEGRSYAQALTIDKSTGECIIGGFSTDTLTFYYLIQKDAFIAKHDLITGMPPTNKTDETGNELFIYANPNKGAFNVKVPQELTNLNNAMLYIYDSNGKETARFKMDDFSSGQTPFFDITYTAKGMYTVKLIKEGKVYTGKIVVE